MCEIMKKSRFGELGLKVAIKRTIDEVLSGLQPELSMALKHIGFISLIPDFLQIGFSGK
jgi:hypothetical protein